MVIKDEAFSPEDLVERAHQKNEIGRIAGMDHVKPMSPGNPDRENKLPKQRGRIFEQIAERALGLEPQGMAIDVDPIYHLLFRLEAFGAWADDRDLVVGAA